MARVTKAGLLDQVQHLSAYQEAWFCRHETPIELSSHGVAS